MADKIQNNPGSIVNSPFYAGYPAWHMDNRTSMPAMKAPGVAGGVKMGTPNTLPVNYASAPRTTYNYNTANYYNFGATPGVAKSVSAPAAAPAKYLKYQPKEYDAYAKQKRRERDYFWVMRRGVCFLMFVLSLLLVMVIAVGIVGLPAFEQYTAMFTAPDITPAEERPEGYQDTTSNISFADAIYGFIGKLTGKQMLDANQEPYTYQANADAVAEGLNAHPEDPMGAIANILVQYFPIAICLFAIFALVVAILAFSALFGKRIFKGFGALSIVMLLMCLIVAAAGLAVLGVKSGAPYIDEATGLLVSVLDFTKAVPFLTGIFSTVKVAYIAGYGLLAMIAGSVMLLLLSVFARRKVPYSVFDFNRPSLDPSL